MKKIIGLCHGVFDLIHFGHIEHFKFAKSKVDYLICSITDDKYVNKGPGKPIYSSEERIRVLQSIKYIDKIILNKFPTSENILKRIKPDIYFKGTDYKDNKKDLSKNIYKEKFIVESYGGKIIYTETPTSSSSLIANNYFNFINPESKKFLRQIKNEKIIDKFNYNFIKNISKKKLLLLGEPIIDSNVFVQTTGKSNKNNIISSQFLRKVDYPGGTILVANLLKRFGCKFDYIVPSNKTNISVLSKLLEKNISQIKIKSNQKIITKTRYVDEYSKQKLYQINSNEIKNNKNNDNYILNVSNFIKKNKNKYDGFIFFDYGYNLFEGELLKLINILERKKIYINCQTNSYNYGFNLFTKFKKSKLVCVDDMEYRLAMKLQKGVIDINTLKSHTSKIKQYQNLIITQGRSGSLHFDKKNISRHFSIMQKTTDTIGCGDIFFTLYALMDISRIFSLDEKMLFSHCAAGLHAAEFSNNLTLNRNYLMNVVSSILKV